MISHTSSPAGSVPRALLSHRSAVAAALIGMWAAVAAPTDAQQPETSTLVVTVVGSTTGKPIEGALVTITGANSGSTDSSGLIRFAGLSSVGITVEIRALGFSGRSLTLDLPARQTFHLTIPLEARAVLLPEVRVGAKSELEGIRSRELRDFYRRVRVGTGRYITRDEIDRKQLRDLSDLFRILPGFSLIHTAAGDKPMMESAPSAAAEPARPGDPGGDCPIQYFLDGTPMTPIHDGVLGAEVEIDEIEGVEIYRRGSGVPAKFHRLNNSCGVILIWKKERM